MPKLTLFCPRLAASSADGRTLTGLLLPFGEPGRTNLGRLTASAESRLDVPTSPVVLNVEHDPKRPVGTLATIEQTAEGLRASFQVAKTRDGDDALAEVAAGLRAALSVEIEPIVTRAGRIVSGVIAGAALVARGAFSSALLAADTPDVPDLGDDGPAHELPDVVINGDELAGVTAVEVTPARIAITTAPSADTPDHENEAAALAASAQPEGTPTMPNAAPVVTNAALAAAQKPKDTSANALFAAFAEAGRTRLNAALSDIVPADILGQADSQPQYVGELWNGKAFERKVVPLFNHGDLTSFKVAGWRWVTKPEVALYTGNKADIPSNTVETEAADVTAQRIAGGHDIDRKYRDFSNAEFWEAYFKAMTESYARVSDAYALAQILAAAPAVTPGSVPSGVAPGLAYIVDGALDILGNTDTMPDFALVTPDLWRAMMFTRADDALAYLNAALGLEDGTVGSFTIKPSAALGTNKVLVGCKSAATVHELSGSPIRVEAIDIARGGIDEALFGYIAVNIHDEGGLAEVTGA